MAGSQTKSGSVVAELARQSQTIEKRNCAKNREAAVDQCPKKWDAANWSANQREGDYSSARDKPDMQNRAVSDRVDERKNEETCDDEMAEGKPVRRITKEWKSRIRLQNSRVNIGNEIAKSDMRTDPTIEYR